MRHSGHIPRLSRGLSRWPLGDGAPWWPRTRGQERADGDHFDRTADHGGRTATGSPARRGSPRDRGRQLHLRLSAGAHGDEPTGDARDADEPVQPSPGLSRRQLHRRRPAQCRHPLFDALVRRLARSAADQRARQPRPLLSAADARHVVGRVRRAGRADQRHRAADHRAGRAALAGRAARRRAADPVANRDGLDHRPHPDQRSRRLRPCPSFPGRPQGRFARRIEQRSCHADECLSGGSDGRAGIARRARFEPHRREFPRLASATSPGTIRPIPATIRC